MKKILLPILILSAAAMLCACSGNDVSAQTRNDLTAEHMRGLYADMNRSDVEDLIGKSDSNLAKNESFEMYSLADGTTAVLRYAGDKLQAAYIRGKDNIEEALFNNFGPGSSSTINDGTESTDSEDNQNESGNMDTNESRPAESESNIDGNIGNAADHTSMGGTDTTGQTSDESSTR